jgi:hypothetical protein
VITVRILAVEPRLSRPLRLMSKGSLTLSVCTRTRFEPPLRSISVKLYEMFEGLSRGRSM